MSGVRVIAGDLKGRIIHFDNRAFDNADITPQKVKGALFSMIGEWLHGAGFLDLYAGSGQIGIEALSRGADPVVFNDTDIRRCRFISSSLDEFGVAARPQVLNLTDRKALEFLGGRKALFRYIFLDPPYEKTRGEAGIYDEIIGLIGDAGVLADGGEIIIQHFSRNILRETIGAFSIVSSRVYGRTTLSVYGGPAHHVTSM
jgi:16S rRNA (guanine966-N2)-methyltransferase